MTASELHIDAESLVGFHDFSNEQYHADPCPEPSLSSSGISTILEKTPEKFKARHPRLTDYPDHIREATKAQDLGSVIHSLILGKGFEVAVFDYDDWRKKEAQAARDLARVEGKIPVLRHVFDEAQFIASKALEKIADKYGNLWQAGESEVTAIWRVRNSQHDFEIWARSLMDHVVRRGGRIWDVKSTDLPIGDVDLAAKFAREGSDIQAAWYVSGFEKLVPELAGSVDFTFIVQEVSPPYDTRFVPMPNAWLTLARQYIDLAVDKFAHCLRSNKWPGYGSTARLEIPGWRAKQIETALLVEEA